MCSGRGQTQLGCDPPRCTVTASQLGPVLLALLFGICPVITQGLYQDPGKGRSCLDVPTGLSLLLGMVNAAFAGATCDFIRMH